LFQTTSPAKGINKGTAAVPTIVKILSEPSIRSFLQFNQIFPGFKLLAPPRPPGFISIKKEAALRCQYQVVLFYKNDQLSLWRVVLDWKNKEQ